MRADVFALVFAVVLGQGFLPTTARGQESQITGLAAVTRAHPSDPAAALSLGHALRRAGRPKEAAAELRRALGAGPAPPTTAALYEELARVYADTRDFAGSMAACERIDHVRGASAEAHACAAEAQFIRQRATEALVETAAALALDPRCYDAILAQARAYELELDTTRAEAALRQAIAIDDGEARAHVALGRVLSKENRHDEALAELRKAAALDPLGPDVLFELAEALGACPESVDLLQRAVRERPAFSEAWLSIGVQELASGHASEAGQAAAQAARTDPNDMHARVLLGQIALAEGHTEEAIEEGHAVLKVVANNAAAELLVGDGNARKGEIDLALEAYQAAWGLDHSNPAPLVNASTACHAAGRDTSARAFGVRATQEFPSWGPAWVALGDALVGQGEKAAAREAYQKAIATTSGPVDRDLLKRRIAAQ